MSADNQVVVAQHDSHWIVYEQRVSIGESVEDVLNQSNYHIEYFITDSPLKAYFIARGMELDIKPEYGFVFSDEDFLKIAFLLDALKLYTLDEVIVDSVEGKICIQVTRVQNDASCVGNELETLFVFDDLPAAAYAAAGLVDEAVNVQVITFKALFSHISVRYNTVQIGVG